MKYRLAWIVLAGVAGCGGAPGEPGDSVGEANRPLVRASAEERRPYVVMIHSELSNGSTVRCTGTYVAPRVVLTAAHCLRYGRWWHGTFVYSGGDYATDLSLLQKQDIGPSKLPADSTQTVWAIAEADETIADYDADLNFPDLAVLYLDRKLPIEPLPVYPKRVDDGWIGKKATLVGWGANEALSADITQVDGVGIKRSGVTRLVGSPTAADYHEEDPNPGMLDANIRSHVIKTDGRDPKPNTCAGDSGGPLILRDRGRDYLAGVSLWTGLWCEDYSLFTRLETFLPFIESAARRAGRSAIVPRLECVEPGPDDTFTAFLGYRNENAVAIEIPYGRRNLFPQDTRSLRPTVFEAGEFPWGFRVDFSKAAALYWRLDPPEGPASELRVTQHSPRCSDDNVGATCLRACRKQVAVTCAPPVASLGTLDECYANCMLMEDMLHEPPCALQYSTLNRCIADLPTDDSALWSCTEGQAAWPVVCQTELQTLLTCMGM